MIQVTKFEELRPPLCMECEKKAVVQIKAKFGYLLLCQKHLDILKVELKDD